MKLLPYILLFYIGFYFYRLAENYKKNKWLFGAIGIVVYFLGVTVYPLFLSFFDAKKILIFSFPFIMFKSFIMGLLCVVVLFQVLSFVWSRKKEVDKKEIDKIGK